MLRKNYWKKRQLSYLKVFSDSLPIFQERCKNRLANFKHEDEISRELSFAIEEIVFQTQSPYLNIGLPSFQVYGQPDSKDIVKDKREDKCPDFLWTYVDYVNKARRDFFVECKRLREDETVHCREYVVSGLKRFTEKEWSYGHNCEIGLIIGYVEGLKLDDCVTKIRTYLKKEKIVDITNTYGNVLVDNVVQYKHSLKRVDIVSSPFELHHYLVSIENI